MSKAPDPPLMPGLALAVFGAIAFSGKAIIVKLAYRYGVDAVMLLMYRMLFALPIFALMAWWASRGKPPLTRNDWLGVVGLGVSGRAVHRLDRSGHRPRDRGNLYVHSRG